MVRRGLEEISELRSWAGSSGWKKGIVLNPVGWKHHMEVSTLLNLLHAQT